MRYLGTKPQSGAATQLGHRTKTGCLRMHVIEWRLCGFVYTRLTCNTPFYFVVMASMKSKYEDMTNKELVEELRARKAKVSGRKKASQSSGDFVYNVPN